MESFFTYFVVSLNEFEAKEMFQNLDQNQSTLCRNSLLWGMSEVQYTYYLTYIIGNLSKDTFFRHIFILFKIFLE